MGFVLGFFTLLFFVGLIIGNYYFVAPLVALLIGVSLEEAWTRATKEE